MPVQCLLFGTCWQAVRVWLSTSIALQAFEMNINARYYSTHPLIEQQHNKGAFENRSNAFAVCLSDAALCSFTKQNPD